LVNAKLCELAGYTQQELLRLRCWDITHAEDLASSRERFERLLQQGEAFNHEQRFVRKTDGDVWVNLSATRIDAETGSPKVLAVVLDITSRRLAEAAAHASDLSYHSLFNSIDAGFCVIRIIFDHDKRPLDYVFLELNAVFERVTGLANARGARMRELAPSHEQHWFDIYGQVATTGEPIRFEHEARALHRWYSVYAFRSGEAGSDQVGVLFEDITARREAEGRRLFVAELAERVASLRDEAAIVHIAVNAVGQFLQVDRCYFVECCESENRIVVGENYVRPGTSSLQGEMTLFQFGGIEWWRRYAAGDFAVSDVTTDPLTSEMASAYAARHVRAYLAQPFKSEGPMTSVLAVTESSARHWTREESKLLENVVSRVWPVVERARSERALLLACRTREASGRTHREIAGDRLRTGNLLI
jgi:PAS domain S-box-containing protein